MRVAIAGPGYIGRVHARAVQSTAGAELVAVLGSNAERAEAFGSEFGGLSVHTGVGALAADPGVDAVVLATPNDLHAPHAEALLAAGKHLLIEKPLARTDAEAESIARAQARSGAVVMTGHMWRFDREAQRVRASVQGGELGRVVKTKGYGIHALWGPGGWFVDRERAGGGALIDMGVHAIDTARYLLGDPEPRSVYAVLGTHFGEYAVDDLGLVVIEWEDGAVSTVESGWWNPHADGPEASTQLFGTGGYARLFPTEIRPKIDGKPTSVELELPPRDDHCDAHVYAGQMAAFERCVRDGTDPVPGIEHGRCVLRICDAAYTSARERRVVAL